MDQNVLVELEQVIKNFGPLVALDRLSAVIPSGRILGLLGPNGAGKSTLMQLIPGLYLPDAGTCKTFGKISRALGDQELCRIGYVHQEDGLIPWLTAGQYLKFISAYYPTWNRSLLEMLLQKLEIRLDERIETMSPGQRQKVALVAAFAHEPDLLLLDEPASALDPIARDDIMAFLLQVIQNPRRTVLISSHLLSDIEKVADEVIILKKGRLVRHDSLDTLRDDYFQIVVASSDAAFFDSLPVQGILEQKRQGSQAVMIVTAESKKIIVDKAQSRATSVDLRPLSLEDIYRLEMRRP